jgi:hypothetical protein
MQPLQKKNVELQFWVLKSILIKKIMLKLIQRVMGKKHEDYEFENLFLHES